MSNWVSKSSKDFSEKKIVRFYYFNILKLSLERTIEQENTSGYQYINLHCGWHEYTDIWLISRKFHYHKTRPNDFEENGDLENGEELPNLFTKILP